MHANIDSTRLLSGLSLTLKSISGMLLLSSVLSACGGGGGGSSSNAGGGSSTSPQVLSGQSGFVSADASASTSNSLPASVNTVTNTLDANKAARTAQEGDIYRVLERGKTILNLNALGGTNQ